MSDGEVTYTVVAVDAAGNSSEVTLAAQKDTVAPAVAISSVTDPINQDNATNTSISGTGEVGAEVMVVADDGVSSTIAFAVTVDGGGNWTISGIDVSALADGTITYSVMATDAAGNTTAIDTTATKNTSVAPLAEALVTTAADEDAIDQALSQDDSWLPYLD